jgi:hypothetical protein
MYSFLDNFYEMLSGCIHLREATQTLRKSDETRKENPENLASLPSPQANLKSILSRVLGGRVTRDRCYDHNFLLFLTIFGEKIGVFLKNQCYDVTFCII